MPTDIRGLDLTTTSDVAAVLDDLGDTKAAAHARRQANEAKSA